VEFITESYSYASTDGRIVLRARIDKPLYFDHAAYEYFCSYSSSVLEYVSDKLFLKSTDTYFESLRNNIRFYPFLYSLKYSATYCDDLYSSFVIVAKLIQENEIVAQGVDSVVFIGKQIVPPGILFKSRKKQKIALDFEGFPSIAELSNDKVVLRRVGKKRRIK
jgi:hypothetical protein